MHSRLRRFPVLTPALRVLIIDESEEDALILTHLLAKAGLDPAPECLRSGEAARYRLRHLVSFPGSPVVIFMATRLPDISGLELLKWVREQKALASTFVVLLAAADEPRNLGKATQLGADGFVVKFPSAAGMRKVLADIDNLALLPAPRPVLSVPCNLLFA